MKNNMNNKLLKMKEIGALRLLSKLLKRPSFNLRKRWTSGEILLFRKQMKLNRMPRNPL